MITYEQLYDLYINKLYSRKQLQEYFNIGRTKINNLLKQFGIKKTKVQKDQTQNKNKKPNKERIIKIKNTCLKKYGVDNVSKLKEVKEKSKKTCLKKYGYEFISQSPEFKAKVAKTNLERFNVICNLITKEGIEKKTRTWLKSFGVNYLSKIEIVEKQEVSKKRNDTYLKEEYIYKKLCDKFGYVKRNYKCERYPFRVDFYIPLEDIFIEYQGFEGHGGHAFNYKNEKDVAILLDWAKKADKKKIDRRNKYLAYIAIWVENDPLKRKVAKNNDLNWFEFFTIEEFDKWYDSY